MKVYIYKLQFQGSTHFGDTGIDLENVCEWVTSDTLFSALVNALYSIKGSDAATEFVDNFKETPPFIMSSLFLYSRDSFYLPRPLADDGIAPELKKSMGKELKKIKWLNADGFLKWIKGDITVDDIKTMHSEQEKYKKEFTIEIRPRVTLDRTTQNSSIYHAGYVYFKEDAGLYGLVAFNDSTAKDKFQLLLKSLGEIGLGGEKTYGCGMYKIEPLQEVSGSLRSLMEGHADRFTLLSLYHPSDNEQTAIADSLVAYDVTRKKGWISSGRYALPLKRKSVGFFTEGSVLKKQLKGCLVDVTPDAVSSEMLNHKVYRYGYAFTAPLRRQQ
jgi:CRISPR-associated protein Csm4